MNLGSLEMVDDRESAAAVEQEVVSEVSITTAGRAEPIARGLFGGVPSLEETQEATADLKDALNNSSYGVLYEQLIAFFILEFKVYGGGTALESGVRSLSNSEGTKDCVAYDVAAIRALKLLNENTAVQSSVASIAADPNVWKAVLNNSDVRDYIKSKQTNDKFEYQASPRSSISSEDYKDSDGGDPFSDFIQKIKTSVVEMVSKVTNLFHGLFSFPTAEKAEENFGSNNIDETIGATLMALAVLVIMVVLVKRG
ncbi:hypothetical protein F3Y22_tig00111754pilonHSYRG00041 [Hibiscus syriacus]|uniref:Uncharacterized protein n=1 Tax=Hibiscus syriacus TaxID=106335 RepID=A0A6A2YHR4_HIBSY|nr:hypothetical protein F3Y22_tig00111754pilonHSYRG00041 [Hibiscus syriacus]